MEAVKGRDRVEGLALPFRSLTHWLKMKNPDAPAVKREAEEDWGKQGSIFHEWSQSWFQVHTARQSSPLSRP